MSEPVISLTSSDEEEDTPEPPSKKRKTISLLVPQISLTIVPKVKKKVDSIETVTLDSDDELEQPKTVSASPETNTAPSIENVDLITLTDDEECVQPEATEVTKVNALLDSILGSDTAKIVSEDDSSKHGSPDKGETVSIIDSDSEPEAVEEILVQATEATKESTDTKNNENVIADTIDVDVDIEKPAEEIVEKDVINQTNELNSNDNDIEENNENLDENNEKTVDDDEVAENVGVIVEAVNGVKAKAIDPVISNKEVEADSGAEANIDSIVIDDSDEETEKENHCENMDLEPFAVSVEKTSAADIPGPSTSKVESFEARAKTLKKFLKIVEEKIVDSSFEEILPKKVPIIQKYFKRCGSYVNEIAFETILKASIESIKKAPTSNATNTAVLEFHKVFEHLKSHVAESTIEIEEEHLPKVKKFEKTMRLLQKRIKQLEEAEVNFDDDEDSAYIMLDRYQARLNKVYVKYCEYIRRNPYTGRAIYDKISFVNSKHNVINQAISRKYKNSVNFPSYYELEKYIEKIAKREKLKLSDQEIKHESKTCFKYLGSILQKKRRQELYDSHLDFIEFTEDPATKDLSLENLLKKNYVEGKDKIEKLYQKFVDKQEQGEDHVSSGDEQTSEETDSEENGKKPIKKNGKNSKKKVKRKPQKKTDGNEGLNNGVEGATETEEEICKKEDSRACNEVKKDGEGEPVIENV